MQTEYDYSVVNPSAVVDKIKLRELAYMIKGQVDSTPTIYKPTLHLRKVNTNNNGYGNIQNVYGNNVQAWKALGASYMRPSAGEIAAKRRREKETKTALRELGRMVCGY
jgi:hypothetical protein